MNDDPRTLTDKPGVLTALVQSVADGGNQRRWCKQHGVSPAYLSDVLSGRRDPGPKILDVLGLEPITVYRYKQKQEST